MTIIIIAIIIICVEALYVSTDGQPITSSWRQNKMLAQQERVGIFAHRQA